MAIAGLVELLKRAYAGAGLDCARGLMPPALKTTLDRIQFRLEVRMPRQLLELYHVHGGQRQVGAGSSGLLGQYRLHTPENLLGDYRTIRSNCEDDGPAGYPPPANRRSSFHRRLLPFASWLAHSLCVDALTGEVYDFHPADGVRGSSRRASIAACLRELLTRLRAGEEPRL